MKILKQENGQSLIEFAFLVGFMLLVTLIFINLGLGYYYKIQLSQLTHDIARVLSISAIEEPSETTHKLDTLLHYYQHSGSFLLDLNNMDRFEYTVLDEIYSDQMNMVTVRATYAGAFYPFIGRTNITSSHTYPKILPRTSP